MRGGGTVNADGFGVGWYAAGDPDGRSPLPPAASRSGPTPSFAGPGRRVSAPAPCWPRCAPPPPACRSARPPRAPFADGPLAVQPQRAGRSGWPALAGLAGTGLPVTRPADPGRPDRLGAAVGAGPRTGCAARATRPVDALADGGRRRRRARRPARGSTCCSPTASWSSATTWSHALCDCAGRPARSPCRLRAVRRRTRLAGGSRPPRCVVGRPRRRRHHSTRDLEQETDDAHGRRRGRGHPHRPRTLDAGAARATSRTGLTATPKSLPPKWFYDARGSELFEEITRLPEYYPTRAERADPRRARRRDRRRRTGADTLVELGSGSSEKTRLLLDALRAGGTLRQFVPARRQSETALRRGGRRDRPGLPRHSSVHGVVGDFTEHLGRCPAATLPAWSRSSAAPSATSSPASGPRSSPRSARSSRPGDGLLLGTDLVKDPDGARPAYDDAAGVTAEFNRNVLSRAQPRARRRLRPRALRARRGLGRRGRVDRDAAAGHAPTTVHGRRPRPAPCDFAAGRGDAHRDLGEVPPRRRRGGADRRRLRAGAVVDRRPAAISPSRWRTQSEPLVPCPHEATTTPGHERKRAPPRVRGGALSSTVCPAASYSPTPFPVQYHRR